MTDAFAGQPTRTRPFGLRLSVLLLAALAAGGCQQKMAEQPYHRPLEQSEFYAPLPGEDPKQAVQHGRDGRASRPLERGVIHRGQYIDSDPMVTGLTRDEWARVYARAAEPKLDLGKPTPEEDRESAVGSPRYDPRVAGTPRVYAEEYPFPITSDDLLRGQERYTIYCAVCHGALGNGQGKIWERGYLNPTSFHTEIVGASEVDLSKQDAEKTGRGISRGYALWGIQIPLRDVPVGYIFEVITKGYGGMPSYSAQIPPADRWRIVAYVRALQYSQHAPAGGKP